MGQQVFIGSTISFASIRDYIFEHKINKGDTLAVHPHNYDELIEEAKKGEEPIDIPFEMLGVRVIKDTTDTVEHGKVMIIKNETLNN